MTLWRILIDTHHKPLFSRDSEWHGHEMIWQRHDVIIWAETWQQARRLALRDLSSTGDRRRVVPDSIVPVVLDRPAVIMQQEVTW